MTSTSTTLKQVFAAARPLVERWLDISEQMAALRDAATAQGLDWSQVKALVKAQVQDERDEAGDGKRVKRIIDKAEAASAYADMLGLADMNEKNFSAEPSPASTSLDVVSKAGEGAAAAPSSPADHSYDPMTGELDPVPMPDFLDRRKRGQVAA